MISLDGKLDVLNSTLLMDYLHILDTLWPSIINIVKPKKHCTEIYNVSALIICFHDNICNFKEKRATVYNRE